ncbi:MAG TPA: exodeoxyribonuclease III [Candidatus Paceibacterota bacterium]
MNGKIVSWNVNGLRAVERRGLLQPFLKEHKPDILCLQEIKIDEESHKKTKVTFLGYGEHWNYGERPGYSGTAILVKSKFGVSKVVHGLGKEYSDSEGRVITAEFPRFYLVNAYFPNSRPDLSRLNFKRDFNNAILKHIIKLNKKKPVIITGDYNVAHEPIDLARPKENEGKHGYHSREREWFGKLLEAGFVDTFRAQHPNKVQYSWWSTRFGQKARTNNVGWRIDYFVVSKRLASKIKSSSILNQVQGSDHCPVMLEMDI